MKTLYEHPDGGRVTWFEDGRIGVITEPWHNDEEASVAVHIGPKGMREVAYALLLLAESQEAKQ